MFSKIKYLAVAAVLALSPVVAAAATLIEDGGTYTIGYAENEFFGNVGPVSKGAGSWSVMFEADNDPVNAEASATIGRIALGQFTGLTMTWLGAMNQVLSSISIAQGGNFLSTVFTVPDLSQTLVFNWTGAKKGAGFDVEVAANVPVPAAGFLLVGALGGIAALRRRKSAALAA